MVGTIAADSGVLRSREAIAVEQPRVYDRTATDDGETRGEPLYLELARR